MVPFVVTTWWVGPFAQLIGGIDIALFVGLAVSAIVYALLARSLNTAHEIAVAEEELGTAGHPVDRLLALTTPWLRRVG